MAQRITRTRDDREWPSRLIHSWCGWLRKTRPGATAVSREPWRTWGIISIRLLCATSCDATTTIRLHNGTITAQFLNAPPPRKQLAVTGGTGIYRNAGVYTQSVGSIGYTGEVAVDWSLTRELKIGIAGLRDARLNDVTIEHQVDRNVVQLRLAWERARFE